MGIPDIAAEKAGKIILIGNPNVGKSVVFGYITGRYVTVSNYPGTTVELSRGQVKERGKSVDVIVGGRARDA
jgi:ferrous iron transport protein B